ncbi:MAG: XRE family transcriptional regulator [Moraxella sp.]
MKRKIIGEHLRNAREQAGFSRDHAAMSVGISRTTLQQWENGATEASLEALDNLAKLYKVSPQYLIFGTENGNTINSSTQTGDNERYYYVPYYKDIVASAGGGKFSDGVIDTDDFLAFRKDWIHHSNLVANKLVALNTDGDSMLPTIPENATIIVDKSKDIAKDGRIYVVRIDNRLYVKRTQWIPTGGLRLISDNPIYESFDITRQELENGTIQIYGQVIHISYDLPH